MRYIISCLLIYLLLYIFSRSLGLLYVDEYAFYRGYEYRVPNQISPDVDNASPVYSEINFGLSLLFYPVHVVETRIRNKIRNSHK